MSDAGGTQLSLDADDTALCLSTARGLRLQVLPVALSVLALMWTLAGVRTGNGTFHSLAWLLLALQVLWATRLYVDMRVFELFARGTLSPQAFDEALHRMHLSGAPKTTPRSIADRVRGLRRLVRWQGLLTTLCLLLPIVAHFGSPDV